MSDTPAAPASQPSVRLDPRRCAVLALHWQVNVIKPEGFFGAMLAEPVAVSGVVERASTFHDQARAAGVRVAFTRFTIPDGEGGLVRNTGFMTAVGAAQEAFRPDAAGTAIIPEMRVSPEDLIMDNQKLSGLAGNNLAERLRADGIDTVLLTGVATNLTVEQTARHATDLGFTSYVVSDAVTTTTADIHDAAIANLRLVSAGPITIEETLSALVEFGSHEAPAGV